MDDYCSLYLRFPWFISHSKNFKEERVSLYYYAHFKGEDFES